MISKDRSCLGPPLRGADEQRQVPFTIDELFFSRTDARGRIKSGNEVFQRVSQFAWSEMIDRPHNIVRHPSMPRAVFQILWDRIRAGVPVGAYVKNIARDGRHYWVFAVVTPLSDGYMSVRLKPTTDMLATVAEIYAQVRSHEEKAGCKPAESATLLEEHLRCLGHHDYDSYQALALDREMTARNSALSRPANPSIECFERLTKSASKLREAAHRIAATRVSFPLAPLNLRVQANELGEDGSAIGVISGDYSMLAETISTSLHALHSAADNVARTMNEGLFLALTSALQGELYEYFATEVGPSVRKRDDTAVLRLQADKYRRESEAKLNELRATARQFVSTTDEMRRFASVLAAVRVMGTVESTVNGSATLDDLIADLNAFQKSISTGLETIWRVNNSIHSDIQLLAVQSGGT